MLHHRTTMATASDLDPQVHRFASLCAQQQLQLLPIFIICNRPGIRDCNSDADLESKLLTNV